MVPIKESTMAGEEMGGVLNLVPALPPGDEEIPNNSNKEEAIDIDKVGHGHIMGEEPDVDQIAGHNRTYVPFERLVGADLGHDLCLADLLAHKVLDAIASGNGHADMGQGRVRFVTRTIGNKEEEEVEEKPDG